MLTIKCKLIANSTVNQALIDTCEEFAKACNAIIPVALKNNETNNIKLHRLCYQELRQTTSLSANLVIRAIRRVSQTLVRAKRFGGLPKMFKPTSVDYDARIFQYRERDESVSLTTVNGRVHIPMSLGEYQRKHLRGKKPTSATLKRYGKIWFININVEEETPEPVKGDKVLGVDMGIVNTIATSEGSLVSGKSRQEFKEKRNRIRASLQSKDTKGSKNLLQRLSGRETRRISWENHNLSKSLVQQCLSSGIGLIRMEDLKNIRRRTKVWNKHLNRMKSGWSFGELQTMICYKAAGVGIKVEFVNPAYTSVTCSGCGKQGERDKEQFNCTTCGVFHSDINGAKNIARGGVVGAKQRVSVSCHVGSTQHVVHPELNVMNSVHNKSKAVGL